MVKHYHILVVDDEPAVRNAIQMLLKYYGHDVHTVESGEAALGVLERDLFDLVITDYSMGGMPGNQLAAIIKQRWPGQPVILATAYAADFHAAGKLAEGVDCVLSKPFSMVELRDAIVWVMSHKAAQPAISDASAPLAEAPALGPLDIPPSAPPGESSSGQVRT